MTIPRDATGPGVIEHGTPGDQLPIAKQTRKTEAETERMVAELQTRHGVPAAVTSAEATER
jgi:hypothetical protein